MATRLFRVHNNGAAKQLFFMYNSQFLFQYSTTSTPNKTSQFLINYLINNLGFSKKDAFAISTNTKVMKSTGNKPQLVLNYFEKCCGLDKTHIGKIVSLVPSLLLCDVDNTLKPKLDMLHDLGLSGSDLVKVITGSVSILRTVDVVEMKSCISFLRQLLLLDEYVVKALKKKPSLLCCKSIDRLRVNMSFFKSIGFSDGEVKKFLLQNPYTLLASPETVEEKVKRLGEDFSIYRGSGMFIYGLDVLISLREETVKAKLGIFRDFGWSDWEIIKLVQLLPYCLRSSEKRLRATLSYYMVELGLKPAYLASHPTLLMFSMKERVLPRLEFMRRLVEKKLYDADYNMYTVLLVSEPKFREAYVMRYKDKIPGVCELYNKLQQHGKAKK